MRFPMIPILQFFQMIDRSHPTMKTTPTRIVSSSPGRTPFAVLLGLLALLGIATRGSAQGTVPERLSFQGYIEDGSGTPLGQVAPANFEVTFRIFPTATGGSSVWTEKQTVTFDKGNYSVLLGQGTEVPPELYPTLSTVVVNANGSELYVETTVTINGNPAKILPRLRLLPTPYSFLAKKALVADQALNVNGSAIAVGSIPDNRLSANIVSGAISDNRLSANVALRNAANAFTGNQTVSGNLGVGTTTPGAKLDVVGGGVRIAGNNVLELGGGVTKEGSAGKIGYQAFSSALDIVGAGTTPGGRKIKLWSEGGASVSGALGINTDTPGATLDVNGNIRGTGLTVNGAATANALAVNGAVSANSLTVNGPVTATTFNGTFNGEKPPQTYTIGAGGNLNTWRDVLVDGTANLGDADGGRIKVLIRNHGDGTVRTWTWDFYAENPTDNFARADGGRWGMSAFQNGAEAYFVLGTSARYDIGAIGNWIWIRNYRSGVAIGGVDGPALTGADRYKFWVVVPPNITATIILYDR